MADDLGAVLEAPEVTGADVDVEQVSESQPEVTDQAVEKVAEEPKGDERLLPQWIRNLKSIDPVGFKEAKGIFFGKRSYDEKLKDFDLDGTKAFLEEHGGRESLSTALGELKGKADEYDGLLEKIQTGNRDVLNDIPPESLVALAPAVAEQWSQVDPEGWSAAMSGVIAATIQQNGIPLFLERLAMNLEFGKTDEVSQMVSQLKGWAASFAEKAQAPRKEQPRSKKTDDGRSALDQEKYDFFISKIRDEADSTFRTPTITKELEGYFKRRPNDKGAQDLAISTVRNQVIERMKADKGYQNSLNALTTRGDREGALKLLKSREEAAIKAVVADIGPKIFGNARPAAEQAGAKSTPGTTTKIDGSFMPIDKPPAPQLIDKFRTTDKMIMNGQFILKDGRKLQVEGY